MNEIDSNFVNEIDNLVTDHLRETNNVVNITDIDFCKLWKTVRHILVFVNALLFWKPSWQKVLKQLIDSLDNTCNVSSQNTVNKDEPGKSDISEVH